MTGNGRPRTVLFLISDTGAGHRSAANAIQRTMRHLQEQTPEPPHGAALRNRHDPNWRSIIVDVFAECGRFPLSNGIFLYGPAIKHSPRLYSQVYHITNSANRFNAAWRLSQPFIRQGLARLIEHTRPDVIVSVHPLLNHITLQVLRDLRMRIPFITVVTDMVSIHAAWIAPGVNACIVPTEAAYRAALDGGITPKRVHLMGMPIDPRFAQETTATPADHKRALGLEPNLPAILLVGGGEGAGGLREAVMALSEQRLRAQLVVITGRNRQLYGYLQRLSAQFRMPAHIFGFVHNMPDMMRAADVIVTKAGPGTISEAMACDLPIVLTGAVPGQEEGNVDFVLENNLGVLATTPEEIVATLHALLQPDNPLLEEMRANVRRLSRPRASFDIARLILSYVPSVEAPSIWEQYYRQPLMQPSRVVLARRRDAVGTTRRLVRRSGLRSVRSFRNLPPIHEAQGLPRRRSNRSAIHKPRLPLPVWRTDRTHPHRVPGLPSLVGARALFLRGTNFGSFGKVGQVGKVQLRRPGGDRGRDDAGATLGGGRG